MAFRKESGASNNSQRSLLAVVMLGVLLTCVAIGWYLVQVRTVYPQSEAAAILAEIRRNGLESYWGDKPERQFFVLVGEPAAGKRVAAGWMVTSRLRTADGYKGMRVERPGGIEEWSLDRALAAGDYTGPTTIQESDDGVNPKMAAITRIRLDDGKVAVQWAMSSGALLLQAPPTIAPENYLPEGATPLVVRLVAQRGRDATFRTIINDESIVNGQLNFSLVKMTPKGRMVEVTTTMNKGMTTAQYFLDENGQIAMVRLKVGSQSADYKLISGEALLRQFPRDPILPGLVRQAQTEPAEPEPSADQDEVQAGAISPVPSPGRT